MSVANPSEVQATFCATLVDEWVRAGLRDVVVCPGSRSTPLALALHARPELTCHVRIDERSAAFFALGVALASKTPVAILVTSGTAAAELHAAVAEADLAQVPLIVITADRPPELRNVGAPQTIIQTGLYASMVRGAVEPGVARADAMRSWRPLAARLWRVAAGLDGSAPGPVHLNASFIEPLVATPRELPEARADGDMWTYAPATPAVRSAIDVAGGKVMCVVGAGVSPALVQELWSLDWLVVGDATTNHTLPYVDPLLRDDALAARLRPDLVVRIGGLAASKVLGERLRTWGTRVVGYTGAGPLADPDGLLSDRLPGLPDVRATQLRGDSAYVYEWAGLSRLVGERLSLLDVEAFNEITVARRVVHVAGELGASLVVGSSMPIRDVEWWSPSRITPTFANRGANGIDGITSTIRGVSTVATTIGFVGDVTFLHDVSGLVDGAVAHSCVIVVADNSGGGIFNFLPQAQVLDEQAFEEMFGTPRGIDLASVATAFGHHATRVTSVDELEAALRAGAERPGVSVVVAAVPERRANVALHASLTAAVPSWVS